MFAKKRFINYCLFGTIAGIIEIGLFYLLNDLIHIHYLISNVISFTIAVIVSYLFNVKYVFKKSFVSKKEKSSRFILFFATRLLGLLLDTGVLAICIDYFKLDNMLSKIIACASTTIVNYFLGKIIFK